MSETGWGWELIPLVWEGLAHASLTTGTSKQLVSTDLGFYGSPEDCSASLARSAT